MSTVMLRKTLNDREELLLQEMMARFKREGLHLPASELAVVSTLKKELAKLEQDFDVHLLRIIARLKCLMKSFRVLRVILLVL